MINEEQSLDLSMMKSAIDSNKCAQAFTILEAYKTQKANIDTKCKNNEQWFKNRNWDLYEKTENRQIQSKSAWLFNAIANKHADFMDNAPSCNVLPREEGDQLEAQNLSSIIPVILDENDFHEVYSEVQWDKLKAGTGIYGIFWDSSKHDGKGDISIKEVDILNLFWEGGIKDIQDSANVFYTSLEDNAKLESLYPQLKGKLGTPVMVNEYVHDDSVDTSSKSLVVDWYYKKYQNGKEVVHFCKFCNNVPLYATENETQVIGDSSLAMRGLYDHGMYPFVTEVLYPVKDSIVGFGYIDIAKNPQEFIDRIDSSVLENLLANARPRYFINKSGSVREEDFTNLNKCLVEVEGSNLGQDSIRSIDGKSLPSGIFNEYENKVNELKEVTGNRDVSTGGTTSGVTAASAIAALQESGSKLSRDAINGSYRAYKRICLMVIELIRQFYDTPRTFRILGEGKEMQFIQYTNENLVLQKQGEINPLTGRPEIAGVDVGYRLPVFDVSVSAEKASPYTKLSNNELALQLYNAGFFNPELAQQALSCLTIMDFDKKDEVKRMIQDNLMQYQMTMGLMAQMAQPMPNGDVSETEMQDESPITANARARVQQAATPR